jgi:hypothetical protein
VPAADTLNRLCVYPSMQRDRLRAELDHAAGETGFYDAIIASRPNLFSDTAVFVSRTQANRMVGLIRAIEWVIALPAYREAVQAWMSPIAVPDVGARGAFLGYDFHLTPAGPQLIEINTNPGGALLNAVLARVHRACCPPLEPYIGNPPAPAPEVTFLQMFREEWRRQRGEQPLERIAIVDDTPFSQFLEPEFRLFATLFGQNGYSAVITDPRELDWDDGVLSYWGKPIDMVYNRLTDFALAETEHAVLRDAYQAGAVVLTPHPRAHALYADKRNLALLSDVAQLRAWGVPADHAALLQTGIPRTVWVTPDNAAALWRNRRRLYFKPAAGFGSKATYRGEKLTRGTWEHILRNDYVAQTEVAPSERRVDRASDISLKVDMRAYVYAGEIQLLAARLYRGQTTNFRTPGGGFAPVYVLPDDLPFPAAAPDNGADTCHSSTP